MPRTYTGKKRFTQEQFERAKDVPLLPFLMQRGYTFKKVGNEYHMKDHDSFVVSNNLWNWNSRGIAGNVISFLTKVENMDMVSAVLCLCGEENVALTAQYSYESKQKKEVEKHMIFPKHNEHDRHVFAYLMKTRCIDKDIISDLMRKGKIYESVEYMAKVKTDDGSYINAKLVPQEQFAQLEKYELIASKQELENGLTAGFDEDGKLKYIGTARLNDRITGASLQNSHIEKINPIYNCVFCGFDEKGTIKYASMRGITTGSAFRQDVIGSDKRYGFAMEGTSDRVYVFEAPIDAISHATLFKMCGMDWQTDSRIALGGVSELALEQFLKNRPDIQKITLCLDNDKTGHKNVYGVFNDEKGEYETRSLLHDYSEKGYAVDVSFSATKDYNSDLVTYCSGKAEDSEDYEEEL